MAACTPSLAVALCDDGMPLPLKPLLLGGEDVGSCVVFDALEASAIAHLQVLQSWPVAPHHRPASSRGSRPGTPLSGEASESASPPASPAPLRQRADTGTNALGAAVTVLMATLTALVVLGMWCPAALPRVHAVVETARQLPAGLPYAVAVNQRAAALEEVLANGALHLVLKRKQSLLAVPSNFIL